MHEKIVEKINSNKGVRIRARHVASGLDCSNTTHEKQQIKALEELDELIKVINKQCGNPFSINTIWNDVSFIYLC